jgi:SM-20-related protein
MTYIDLAAFDRAPLQKDPYDFVILPHFIRPERFNEITADFPAVPGAGSHPPAELDIKGHFSSLIEELQGPAFRQAIETKFGIDLSGRPTMYTVRGFVGERDGDIHTDSRSKLITVLIYMNEGWEADGGRLRILRSGMNLEDSHAEVAPDGGTLLVFRRSEKSWHGHKRHVGPRRVIQLNWVTSQEVVEREQGRHGLSSKIKRVAKIFARR